MPKRRYGTTQVPQSRQQRRETGMDTLKRVGNKKPLHTLTEHVWSFAKGRDDVLFRRFLHLWHGIVDRLEDSPSIAANNVGSYTSRILKGEYITLYRNYVAIWDQYRGFIVFETKEHPGVGLIPVSTVGLRDVDLDILYKHYKGMKGTSHAKQWVYKAIKERDSHSGL